jgi:hypothetical protein
MEKNSIIKLTIAFKTVKPIIVYQNEKLWQLLI